MAIRSHGFRLYIDNTKIAGIKESTPPSPESSIIDITTHDSTAREFVGGMIDGGTLTVSGLYDYDDAGQAALFGHVGTEGVLRAVFSDGSSLLFTGQIQSFGDTDPLDDAVGFTASVKVTGLVEWHEGITIGGTLSPDITGPLLWFDYGGVEPAWNNSTDDGYAGGDVTQVFYELGTWYIIASIDGEEAYNASKASAASSPIGLTGWSIIIGTGQPTII